MGNAGGRYKVIITVMIAAACVVILNRQVVHLVSETRYEAGKVQNTDIHFKHAFVRDRFAKVQELRHVYDRFRRSSVLEEGSGNAGFTFSNWGAWTTCSSQDCHVEGKQWKYRTCYGNDLQGDNDYPCNYENLTQSRPCYLEGCENVGSGLYSWSEWSACSVTCGEGGIQTRNRLCKVDGNVTSDECNVITDEERNCQYSVSCPTWEQWTSWSTCSETCEGEGISSRKRDCVIYRNFIPGYSEFSYVSEYNEEMMTRLENAEMDISGATIYRNGKPIYIVDARGDLNSELSVFLPPNTLRGEQTRIEECIMSNDSYEEQKSCVFDGPCPSQWGLWQTWTACHRRCGPGFRKRERTCIFNSKKENCEGQTTLYRRCLPPPCWAQWVNVGQCSETCGSGIQRRVRKCNLYFTLLPCAGPSKSVTNCTLVEPCESDGWTVWSPFTECTASCNRGLQYRNRTCLKASCRGDSNDPRLCNTQRCPSWNRWEPYSCCSVTCGPGLRSRTRTCMNGNIGDSGCNGTANELNACYLSSCETATYASLDNIPCGTRASSTLKNIVHLRIFQGKESLPHSWPWQASWQHRMTKMDPWKHFCGATLLHPRWVVTAAHCIEDAAYAVDHKNPGIYWSIVLGAHKLYEQGKRFSAERVFVHPKYSRQLAAFSDIALIKLREMVTITEKISPICISASLYPQPGESCIVTGWGTKHPGGPYSNVLMEGKLSIVSVDSCRSLGDYYRYFLSEKLHMCARNPVEVAADSCKGDSGGPLSCRNGTKWYLAGITSFAFAECGTPGHSGIYTSVRSFEEWIREIVDLHTYEQC